MYVADDAPGTAKKQLDDATWGYQNFISTLIHSTRITCQHAWTIKRDHGLQ